MAAFKLLNRFRSRNKLSLLIPLFFIALLSWKPASAQFHEVHVEPDVDHAVKLDFYTANEGYVAFNKYIGYTVDSGKTFVQKTITNSNVDYSGNAVNLTFGFTINGVKAISKTNILVYGDYSFAATILSSNDGGNTFKIIFYDPGDLNSGGAPSMTDMVFPQNDGIGYAVYDHHVLKSTNNGQSWSQYEILSGGPQLSSLQFIDDNNGIAFGAGGPLLQLTSAGGWQNLSKPAGNIKTAYFINSKTGWVANDDGTVYYTSNSGTSWTQQNIAPGTTLNISKMQFVNDSTGYAIATGFDMYKTSNYGKIWEKLPRNNNYSYLGYSLTDLQILSNVTWAAGGHGYIATSNNNGGPYTLPLVSFAVDTTGLSNTGDVNLYNYSKSGYQYQWYVDGKSAGSSYNTSYTHNIFHLTDTLSLIVSNSKYKDTLTQYAYFHPTPLVKSFTPAAALRGDMVTITGFNFQGATAVYFGGVAAASFTVVSSTTITAIVGSGASGNVEVVTPYGATKISGFTYVPGPSITSFSPQQALAGSTITINGAYFIKVKQVLFGGIAATSFSVVSPTQITAVVGNGNSGSITVTTTADSSATAPGFEMIPMVTSFSPTSGTAGTLINIRGTGLNHVSSVLVGGVAVQSFVVDSATSVTAVVGLGATGNVAITAPGGNVSVPLFTYYNKPNIKSFSPLSGPAGTVVTITGTNFSSTVSDNNVFFGAVKANILSATSTTLTVTAPVGLTYSPIIVETHHLLSYAEFPFTITFPNGGGIGPNSFTPAAGITLSSNVGLYPSIADLDGDGKPDIINYNQNTFGYSILINTGGAGKVSYVQQEINYINAENYCITDMDGDGLPDLVTFNGSIVVYKNLSTPGNVVFGQPIYLGGPANLQSGTAFDMDGDGRADIIATNSAGIGLTLYRNLSEVGKLAFQAPVTLSVGSGNAVVVSDFDGDGKLDMLVPYSASSSNNQSVVLLNKSTPGNFLFKASNPIAPSLYGPVFLSDIDGDNKTDLVTLNNSSNQLLIYRNLSTAGNISFAPVVAYQTEVNPSYLAVADLDGDGKPDIAVQCFNEHVISVYKNLGATGNINFASPIDFSTGTQYSGGLSIGDIDGDGKNDLLFAVGGNTTVALLNNVKPAPLITAFTPSHGVTGTVVNITGLNFTSTTSVTFGGTAAASFTVNSDKSITAIVGNGSSGSVAVTNAYDTSTVPGFAYGTPPVISSFSPRAGKAGTPVTITGNYFDTNAANNIVYFGGVKATVTSATATQLVVNAPAQATYQPISVTTPHNLTGYSRVPFDITFAGDTAFTPSSFSKKFTMPGSLAVTGDIDGDGKLDLAFIAADGNVSVALNTGLADSISFGASQEIGSGAGVRRLYLADINADGKLDIVSLNSNPGTISIYTNTSTAGNVSFTGPLILTDLLISGGFDAIQNLAINDLDGDGLPDIAGSNYDPKTVSIYHNVSSGNVVAFAPRFRINAGDYPEDIALTDIDGDGKPDLLIGLPGNENLYKNTSVPGTISFGPQISLTGGNWQQQIHIGDLDGDGKPDVATVNTSQGGLAFFRNTSSAGNFSFATTVTPGGPLPDGLGAIADLNGDGKPDFLLNDPTGDAVDIFKNSSTVGNIVFDGKDGFYLPNINGFTSVGDMDQDGKPDIIESNYTTITIYRNITAKPLLLPDTNFRVQFISSTCVDSNNGMITINAATSLPYTATVTGPNSFSAVNAFTKTLTVSNLDTGAYNVCITVAGYPDFQQCYSAGISQPKPISAYATVDNSNQTVHLALGGAPNYTIQVNNNVYQTSSQEFNAPLQKGNNEVTVSTGKDCQGVIKQRITIGNDITIYPNPFEGLVQMDVGQSQAASGRVEIVDMLGNQVFVDDAVNNYGKLNLDLSALKSGVYVVKLTLDNKQTVYKIWKK